MKNKKYFALGVVAGALISGCVTLAAAGITAYLTSQSFTYNGNDVNLEAYEINGFNYIKLRDAAELFGVPVQYDEETNKVFLGDTDADSKAPSYNAAKKVAEDFIKEYDWASIGDAQIADLGDRYYVKFILLGNGYTDDAIMVVRVNKNTDDAEKVFCGTDGGYDTYDGEIHIDWLLHTFDKWEDIK